MPFPFKCTLGKLCVPFQLQRQTSSYPGERACFLSESYLIMILFIYICDRRRVSQQTQLKQTMANLYTLTSENFDKHVEIGLHFIKFYAPWFVESRIKTTFGFAFLFALRSFCINSVFFFLTVFFIRCSHCRKLAPTWKALAEYHKDNMDITIAKVQ